MRTRITKKECIAALLEANRHVEILSISNYSKLKKSPSVSVIVKLFGSWKNAIKAAGIIPIYDAYTDNCSKKEAIHSIKNSIKKHGTSLTRTEYIQGGFKPTITKIEKIFGSYQKALIAANIYKCRGNNPSLGINTEFVSRKHVAEALGCSANVITRMLGFSPFVDYVLEIPNGNSQKGTIIISKEIITNMRKFYVDNKQAYEQISRDPKYVSLGYAKNIYGKTYKELIEEIQEGKWDGKFSSIFRTSSHGYEGVTNEHPYVYFLEKKYVKEQYTDSFPLYRVAAILNTSTSTLKSYEMAEYFPKPKIKNNIPLYNLEEVKTFITKHSVEYNKQKLKNSNMPLSCFDYLSVSQQNLINEYIHDRKSGILIKYEGYTAKRGVSNPSKTFPEMKQILSCCFFKVICGRLGIIDIPMNRQLNSDQLAIYNPDVFDIESPTWHDYPYISANRKSNTLIVYYNQLRTFYYWILMKKEIEELNNLESDYRNFKKLKRNILSFLNQFPQSQKDINPYETVQHMEKSFLTREQMINVKQLLLKDPIGKNQLRNATIWQLCCTTGIRPEEVEMVRIEHFHLTSTGYIEFNKHGWGILNLPKSATKKNYSPSHRKYGTLIPKDTVNQLNIYLKKLYDQSGNSIRGNGYLFRPNPLSSETPYKVLKKSFIKRIRPFLTFLQPKQQQDFVLKSSRHSMNNLIMKANLPDKTIGAQTQKIAAQHQMRHAPEKLSVAEKYYLDDITQEEFYSVLNYTINFPWNKKELALWEIQNEYRTISSTFSAEVPNDIQNLITKIKVNQEKEEFQQKKEMEEKISAYKNEIVQINKTLAQTTRPPKGIDIREFMFERKKLREKKENLEKIITHALK